MLLLRKRLPIVGGETKPLWLDAEGSAVDRFALFRFDHLLLGRNEYIRAVQVWVFT